MHLSIPLSLILLTAACGTEASPPSAQRLEASESQGEKSQGAKRHPDRLLTCTLGRALGLDPNRMQTVDDVKYEGAHSFSLLLPSAPVRTGPPPEPTDLPEPVDPRTQILADPSGLARDVPPGFLRVVDMWPDRVEMMQSVSPPTSHLIIVSDIDTANNTASLFMTHAQDAATFDLDRVYQGKCKVKLTQG